MNRRDFLRAGMASGTLAFSPFATMLGRANQGRTVALVADPADAIVASVPVTQALAELQRCLEATGVAFTRHARLQDAPATSICVVASGCGAPIAAAAIKQARLTPPTASESVVLAPMLSGRQALLAAGTDARGLVYALRELADRVTYSSVDAALRVASPIVEQPLNRVRSIMRQATSETLDKPWLFDREMWPRYVSMLATQRFNRLHLGFGLGYDTLQGVTDSYLVFAYPFFVNVPGYSVRLSNFTDTEREQHLDILRFISEQTVAHGLDFQLGVWMHGFQLPNSPRAKYVVEGLTPANHAAYCRDALATILKACPSISSFALRIHGESGIAEGSYEFWKTVFAGVPLSGRTLEIDLHAKGIDQTMIDHALATGMPVNLSPKYWAEHLGMPYHQAAIRDLEMPVAGQVGRGLMTLSEGQRVFTRYGYADLMRDDRRFTVRHRVFSGSQRLLLGADPRAAASYSRMFTYCDSTGMDLMEPLTCRGRRGTGIIGGTRTGYTDVGLEPKYDWQKFEYWYRVWGRLAYNPNTPAEAWRRQFKAHPHTPAIESALANASRILPIITTAHLPSAACDAYWPEVYWNQPITAVGRVNPYGDSPAPKTFQNVSPLDPQMFSTMTQHAEELLSGTRGGKYSPIEVAEWLDTHAAAVTKAVLTIGSVTTPEARRIAIDVDMQSNIGRFFAAKFRAGVLFAIHERTSSQRALEEAIKAYRMAREHWAAVSKRAEYVYATELAASDKVSNKGAWADRLPAIDQDIEQMNARLADAIDVTDPKVTSAIAAALGTQTRGPAPARHTPPSNFTPGKVVPIAVATVTGRTLNSARLYYRHINQAERYESIAMVARATGFAANIPAAYTDSPYPLQYYVEITEGAGRAWILPGFDADLSSQPYVTIRRA
jgi:hypothetical protein